MQKRQWDKVVVKQLLDDKEFMFLCHSSPFHLCWQGHNLPLVFWQCSVYISLWLSASWSVSPAMLGVSVIIVAPTVKDSYWFMLCQFFSHIQYNQSSDSCRIIQVKLHQGLLGFCASSHTNMCLAAWVAIRKHAVGVGRGWEPISFFTAELPWCTSSCVPCPSLVSSPTPP